MARVTIEDCLTHIPNRFELVLIAARRAVEITQKRLQNSDPFAKEEKAVVTALRDIAEGSITSTSIADYDRLHKAKNHHKTQTSFDDPNI